MTQASTQSQARSLPIYVRTRAVVPLGWSGRAFALGIAMGCMALLIVAATIRPDVRGIGTHEQLGLAPCGFVALFGIPCPSCGYTTSFSLFAHGRWIASFWNQPAGFLLALTAGMTAWAGLYAAITGVGVHHLFSRWMTTRNIFGGGLVIILAWAWKIALVKAAVIH